MSDFTDEDVQEVACALRIYTEVTTRRIRIMPSEVEEVAREVLSAVVPGIVQRAKAEAWGEGAREATMDYGIGHLVNPYSKDGSL